MGKIERAVCGELIALFESQYSRFVTVNGVDATIEPEAERTA